MAVALALVAVAALGSLLRWAARFDPSGLAPSDDGRMDPVITASDCVTLARSKGALLWRISSRSILVRTVSADLVSDVARIELQGLSHGVINYQGRKALGLRASSATYTPAAGRLDVAGPLVLRTDHNERLEAPSCSWSTTGAGVTFGQGGTATTRDAAATAPFVIYSPGQRRVDCPNGAHLTDKSGSLDASVLYWDLDRGLVDCPGPVTGRRTDWFFTARRAALDLANRTLSANDGSLQARILSEDGHER